MLIAIITAILLFIVIFIFACLYLNEYSLPKFDIEKLVGKKKKYRILSIYPHPDDETMGVGGLLAVFGKKKNIEIKNVCLTHGEKGDELMKIPAVELGEIREKEYIKAMKELGVEDVEIWDYKDGKLEEQEKKLTKSIDVLLGKYKPHLVITYEKAGVYGHPDHVLASKVIHQLIGVKYSNIKILYNTLPKNIYKHANLPVHMANGKEVLQAPAKYRLPVYGGIFAKIRAAKRYKSQKLNHNAPIWVICTLLNNEYFTDKY